MGWIGWRVRREKRGAKDACPGWGFESGFFFWVVRWVGVERKVCTYLRRFVHGYVCTFTVEYGHVVVRTICMYVPVCAINNLSETTCVSFLCWAKLPSTSLSVLPVCLPVCPPARLPLGKQAPFRLRQITQRTGVVLSGRIALERTSGGVWSLSWASALAAWRTLAGEGGGRLFVLSGALRLVGK
jgi:hypothetical protein